MGKGMRERACVREFVGVGESHCVTVIRKTHARANLRRQMPSQQTKGGKTEEREAICVTVVERPTHARKPETPKTPIHHMANAKGGKGTGGRQRRRGFPCAIDYTPHPEAPGLPACFSALPLPQSALRVCGEGGVPVCLNAEGSHKEVACDTLTHTPKQRSKRRMAFSSTHLLTHGAHS